MSKLRVCMILEGSYPYVTGGVSSWMHQYIQAMPDVDFVLWCIGANSRLKGRYKYKLPPNVVEVHEVFLNDALSLRMSARSGKINRKQHDAVARLFRNADPDWDELFDMFQRQKVNPVSLLMSPDFLEMVVETCRDSYPYISFADYFHTVRSMMLPELYLMGQDVPKADIYHATATGYSGILASLGKWTYHKPMILTEHGIYTREREEELLRATWVLPCFRKQWIELFYAFSKCSYDHADRVTALFPRANDIQAELGCGREKLRVIQNGIHYEKFVNIPPKKENGLVDIGAVVRIAKIKDIKTMIYAFAEVKHRVPNARLHILGGVDDPEYFAECQLLIQQLELDGICFPGLVKVEEYIEKLDFTILTSISEGQPLSVLESMAAGRPCVVTDVGCCKDLVQNTDGLGEAGICVPPMHKEMLADAIVQLCENAALRQRMGQAGQKRACTAYTHELSMEKYRELYKEVT